MKEKGMNDVLITGGGIIPDDDMKQIEQNGSWKIISLRGLPLKFKLQQTNWVKSTQNCLSTYKLMMNDCDASFISQDHKL